MKSDNAFFLQIGYVPINKPLRIRGSNNQTVKLHSLLLDPWFFNMPGFARLFHTHIFAPKSIAKAFMAEGYRLLNRTSFQRNIAHFFDDANNHQIHKMERRKNAHGADRATEQSRKRQFMDHYLETEMHEEVSIEQIQEHLYQPIPQNLPMDHYLCIQEYRFQQYLRFLVGVRFLATSFSSADLDLDLSFRVLDHMASQLHGSVSA